MSEWNELHDEEVEIVDVDIETDDTQDVDETISDDVCEESVASEWGNLSDEEMERRGARLAQRISLESSLRHMRLDDLRSGEYEKDLLSEKGGTSGELDDIANVELEDEPFMSEWNDLSDEEMERRGEQLVQRIELETSLRQMRLDDLKNGEYEKDLLERGEDIPSVIDDISDEIEDDGDLSGESADTPSELERLRTLKQLIEEHDPETYAILEGMYDVTDEEPRDPPQKVLKRR